MATTKVADSFRVVAPVVRPISLAIVQQTVTEGLNEDPHW